MIEIFILLIVFQVKHYLCDFPFQSKYMLGKFKLGTAWILPLAFHAGVHAGWTFIICMFAGWRLIPFEIILALTAFDFWTHFVMDRIKASPKLLGKYGFKNKYFWWTLGFDQMVHHLTHYFIIFILVSK